MDLLGLQKHKVSKDLSGYISFIYGAPKTGKTTLATQMPNSLLLAFEKGYNALPGIYVQDITSWGEMKQAKRELQRDEVKAMYKSLIIDTVDIAATFCEKYICGQNGIEALGDLAYGKGWTLFKKEFETMFRDLTQLGYAVFFISHDKEYNETDDNGKETGRVLIRPSLSSSPRAIVENMADIYGYAKTFWTEAGSVVKLLLRSDDGRISCGCRFKYINPVIDFNYESLSNALAEAIEKEAKATNNQFVTDQREPSVIAKTYDYDALIKEFNSIIETLMGKNPEYFGPCITQVVDKYLGKGKKVSETDRNQAEFIFLIVNELKDEYMNDNK